MLGLFKFFCYFLLYGLAWFFIFSIPVDPNSNVLLSVQKMLNMSSAQKPKNTKINKKEIQQQKVIDALTHAFKPD